MIKAQVPNATFTYEEYFVTTADGYNLTLNRLYKNSTSPKPKYPVLLSHGILTNGLDWTISGKPKSIAFELADTDQDVWMLSSRKNMVSSSDTTFYNSTFEVMGSLILVLCKELYINLFPVHFRNVRFTSNN